MRERNELTINSGINRVFFSSVRSFQPLIARCALVFSAVGDLRWSAWFRWTMRLYALAANNDAFPTQYQATVVQSKSRYRFERMKNTAIVAQAKQFTTIIDNNKE